MGKSGQGSVKKLEFATFAWYYLGYNILVILWGAWVRISGSGAGCGSNWPDCNGDVVPVGGDAKTMVEFTHRATSGLCLIGGLILFFWARKLYKSGELKRHVFLGAVGTLIFIFLEALLGAALVKFELVADDDSVARAVVICLHLINTQSLLGFGALTAHWASGGKLPQWSRSGAIKFFFVAGLVLLLITSMAGAITALGDTLFPLDPDADRDAALRDAVSDDPSLHFLVRLRVLHPVIAVVVALGILVFTVLLNPADKVPAARKWNTAVTALIFAQIVLGALNIMLAAPAYMQILHLLFACLVWIAFLLLANTVLAHPEQLAAEQPSAG